MTPTTLSPAAQAVLDVYWRNVGMPPALAKELGFTNTPLVVALRAAADQVVPIKEEPSEPPGYGVGYEPAEYLQDWTRWHVRSQFLAIAAELEGQ
jgi:hypothetical protein